MPTPTVQQLRYFLEGGPGRHALGIGCRGTHRPALNTIMYVALAIAKMLPKLYLSDWVRRQGRRAESRSIHSDDPIRGESPVRAAKNLSSLLVAQTTGGLSSSALILHTLNKR